MAKEVVHVTDRCASIQELAKPDWTYPDGSSLRDTTMSRIHENWTVNCMIDTQPFDVWHPRYIFFICWNWNPILNDWGPTYCLVTFCRTLIDKSGLKRFHITLMLCLMYHGHTAFISVSLFDLYLYFMMCFTRLQSVSYNIIILSRSS